MDDSTILDGDGNSPAPTAASILGIKGHLRFRPHGSSQKAHVVLRRIELSDDSGDEGDEKPTVYFSLFAQKRIEVKPGKEILLTLAEGPFKDRAIIFEADIATAITTSDEEEGTQVAEDEDDFFPPEQSIPPKMRKTWIKRFEEPHPTVPPTRSYASVSVQTDFIPDTSPPSTATPQPEPTKLTQHVGTQTPQNMTPPAVPQIPPMTTRRSSSRSSANAAGATPVMRPSATVTKPSSQRERSLSPMDLDSAPSSPILAPTRASAVPPLALSEEKIAPAATPQPPTPSVTPIKPTVPSLPFLLPPNTSLPPLSAHISSRRKNVEGNMLASPPSVRPPPPPPPMDAPPPMEAPSPPTEAPPMPVPPPAVVPKKDVIKMKVKNPFVSGGFMTDFVSLPSTPPPVATPENKSVATVKDPQPSAVTPPPTSAPATPKTPQFAPSTKPLLPPRITVPSNGLSVKREESPAHLPTSPQTAGSIGNIQSSLSPPAPPSALPPPPPSPPRIPSPKPVVEDRPPSPSWPPFKQQQDWTSTVDMDSDPPFRATPLPPTPTPLLTSAKSMPTFREPSFVPASANRTGSFSGMPPPISTPTSSTPKSVGPSTYGSPSVSGSNSHPLPAKPLVSPNLSHLPRHASPLASRASEMRGRMVQQAPAIFSIGFKRKVSSPSPDSPAEPQTPRPQKRVPPSYWQTSLPLRTVAVKGDNVGIRGITFNSIGTLFAVNCRDHTIRVFDNVMHAEVARLPHPTPVVAAVWMHEDVGILALCENGSIIKWTRPAAHDSWHWGKIAEPSPSERKADDVPTAMAYVRERIAVAFPRLGVKVWMLNKGVWQSQRSILRQNVTAIKFVEDGDALLGGTKDGVLWYCQIPNGTLRAYTFFKSKVYHIDVTMSGTHALVAQLGGRTHLVGIRQDDNRGKIEQVYAVKEPSLQNKASYDAGALFAVRDSMVMFGSVDGYVLVWDRNRAEVVCGLDHGEGTVAMAIGSCHGGGEGCMITGSHDGQLTWWAEPIIEDSPYKRMKTS